MKTWKTWTQDDDALLAELLAAGASFGDMANRLGRPVFAVYSRRDALRLPRRFEKHPRPKRSFFARLAARSAYVYGFLATDGCNHSSQRIGPTRRRRGVVTISQSGESGRELLLSICRFSGGYVAGPYWPRLARNPQFVLELSDPRLIPVVESFGIAPRKAARLVPPELPDRLWPHYFRGVVDGDGSISLCGASRERMRRGLGYMQIRFGSASKKFRDAVAANVGRITGVPASMSTSRKDDGRKNEYVAQWTADPAMRIAGWMYTGKERSFWLGRKFAIYEAERRRQPIRRRLLEKPPILDGERAKMASALKSGMSIMSAAKSIGRSYTAAHNIYRSLVDGGEIKDRCPEISSRR